jgi:hypothetical protein
VLAALADRAGKTPKATLAELRTAGRPEKEIVAIVRKGLTKDERAELKTLLSETRLSTQARALFEAVLGGVPTRKAPLDVEVTSRGLRGLTKPNATIEAVNLSASAGPNGDAFVVGKADGDGRFSARLEGTQRPKDGDSMRLRARFDDGTASDWIVVNAGGRDARPAELNVNRLELTAADGRIEVHTRDANPTLAEPGSLVALTNLRTGKQLTLTLDDRGRLPDGASTPGKPGDRFSVAISDGVHNRSFKDVAGHLTVAGGDRPSNLVPTPALHSDELKPKKPTIPKATFSGPLFLNGASAADVHQGMLANCYFPAAIGALVTARPGLMQDLIKDNGDGTFTVTFFKRDALDRVRKVPVTVDSDLWVKPGKGTPLYGRGGTDLGQTTMELWYPLLEKAYAQWKGSYDTVGSGGSSSDVFEELTGELSEYWPIDGRSTQDAVWKRVVSAIDDQRPLAAGTHGEKGPVHYTNTGVLGDHAYSIVGYQQEGDKRFVVLRNPWGDSEPRRNGPNDGVFKLPLERFMQLFCDLMTLEKK